MIHYVTRRPTRLRPQRLGRLLLVSVVLFATLLATPAHAQENFPPCTGLVFSTEEDFLSRGPKPPDGNPIISDGDLLSRNLSTGGVAVCARNRHLLRVFEERVDLGLDAVDVIHLEEFLITFSTELDDPRGRFTAGDLLATNGAIIPNNALLFTFQLPIPEQNLGLDSVQLVGKEENQLELLRKVLSGGRDFWAANPRAFIELLRGLDVDIWFSTEGTGFSPEQPSFLDGDLLSARDGVIVIPNSTFLPALPAGLPANGVDFGLDAFTFGFDQASAEGRNLFSTEILSKEPELSFTDGDVLQQGNGIVLQNFDLTKGFEPLVRELGLDALDLVNQRITCEGVEITEVGGVQTSLIDPGTGYARKEGGAFPPAPLPAAAPFDKPFGNWVSLRGNVPGPDCVDVTQYEYRLEWIGPIGGWTPIVTHPAWQANQSPFCSIFGWAPYQSDADGWIPLANYWQAENCQPSQALNVWNTSGQNGRHQVRLTLRQNGNPATAITSAPVTVGLDNIAPNPLFMELYDGTSAAPLSNQCEITGTTPTTITIKGQARDEHFYAYSLAWTGGDVHSWVNIALPTAQYPFYDGGRPDLDDTGTLPAAATNVPLGTLNLTAAYQAQTGEDPIKCGYTIMLTASDRTYVGYFYPVTNGITDRGGGWSNSYLQSFCFTPEQPEDM